MSVIGGREFRTVLGHALSWSRGFLSSETSRVAGTAAGRVHAAAALGRILPGAYRIPMDHATRRSVDAYPNFPSVTQTHRLSVRGCSVKAINRFNLIESNSLQLDAGAIISGEKNEFFLIQLFRFCCNFRS